MCVLPIPKPSLRLLTASFSLSYVCCSLSVLFPESCLPFQLRPVQPMEIFVDDETKLTLHGLQQYYVKLKDNEKNRKLFDLLDALEFNQVPTPHLPHSLTPPWTFLFCPFAFLLMGIRLLMSYKHVTVGPAREALVISKIKISVIYNTCVQPLSSSTS